MERSAAVATKKDQVGWQTRLTELAELKILRSGAHGDGSLDAVISESPLLKITDWRMRVCKNLTRS
jgi:hypothetical protein